MTIVNATHLLFALQRYRGDEESLSQSVISFGALGDQIGQDVVREEGVRRRRGCREEGVGEEGEWRPVVSAAKSEQDSLLDVEAERTCMAPGGLKRSGQHLEEGGERGDDASCNNSTVSLYARFQRSI